MSLNLSFIENIDEYISTIEEIEEYENKPPPKQLIINPDNGEIIDPESGLPWDGPMDNVEILIQRKEILSQLACQLNSNLFPYCPNAYKTFISIF